MANEFKKFTAIDIPTAGTYRLVPEVSVTEISDALERTAFFVLPKPQELTFSYLLIHHREARNLSQEQLADLAKIGQKHISNIEKGAVLIPRMDTLEKLFPHLDAKFKAGALFILKTRAEKKAS